MLCHSFIRSATHSYALLLIRTLPFTSAFILMPHHRFEFVCVFGVHSFVSPVACSHSCPRPHACGHMRPWALHPHLGPSVCLKKLLWFVCTIQGPHYEQTSPWGSFAPPRPYELPRLECPCWCACDRRGV